MPDRKKITSLAGQRSELIQKLLDRLEEKVIQSQRDLLQYVLADFVDGMETDEDGNIKNTLANKRRLSMFDQVFTRFAEGRGLDVVKTIIVGVESVTNFNEKYFSLFAKPAALNPVTANVQETLQAWLGITPRGKVAQNGYLDTLINDRSVKNKISDIVLKSVVSQAGYFDTKKALQLHIEGNRKQTGTLQRYYRNFAYDTFSVADRTASKTFADKLKFNYAIYEGGLVKDSRDFCRKHNGKVYSREEIAAFDPKEARPPGYDPFVDLGGYACRHHLNWIPDEIAFAMRPELKNQ
jgi:hypothetical protein